MGCRHPAGWFRHSARRQRLLLPLETRQRRTPESPPQALAAGLACGPPHALQQRRADALVALATRTDTTPVLPKIQVPTLILVGDQDVLLGHIGGQPFYIGAAQFEYWQHTQLIIDVVPGRGSGFSVEAPEGVRFLTRSRVFTDDEVTELETAGPPSRGA